LDRGREMQSADAKFYWYPHPDIEQVAVVIVVCWRGVVVVIVV
jgi:hypothetical protein